jgi:hypothetical protein
MERLPVNEKALGEAMRWLFGREMSEHEIATPPISMAT